MCTIEEISFRHHATIVVLVLFFSSKGTENGKVVFNLVCPERDPRVLTMSGILNLESLVIVGTLLSANVCMTIQFKILPHIGSFNMFFHICMLSKSKQKYRNRTSYTK